MTEKDFGKKITLNKIREELYETEFVEMGTSYRRFTRLMKHLNTDMDEIKDGNNIYFYEDEKEFVKGLILEMGEPYLKNLTNKKIVGKSLEDGYNEAVKFTERMMKRVNNMQHEELKIKAIQSIELLSRQTSRDLAIKTNEKIKEIGDFITSIKLYSAEYNGLLMEINDALEKYHESLKKRFENRQI